jgi:hypothetical protein
VQPTDWSFSSCCLVSTPSAVETMLRLLASVAIARTMASGSDPFERSLMKERSILILSNGKLRR